MKWRRTIKLYYSISASSLYLSKCYIQNTSQLMYYLVG